jgi:ATP-binding cassette subfamily B protein
MLCEHQRFSLPLNVKFNLILHKPSQCSSCMFRPISEKFKKLKTDLNLKRTIILVWKAAKGWLILSVIMIVVETMTFLGSLYALKVLVDKVAHINLQDPGSGDIIIKYVSIAGSLAVLYAIARSFSTYVTEVQATKISSFMDEQIHSTAVEMDLSYYESPDYFDVLQRAKDAGVDRPNQLITTMVEISKNTLNLGAVGSIFISINWVLLPLLIIFVLPTLFVRIYFARQQNSWRIKHTALERKAAYLSDLITSDVAAKEIRSFNLGDHFKSLYLKLKQEVFTVRLAVSYRRTLSELITTSLASIGFFVCIGYIALGSIRGTSTVGDIVLFLVIFPQSFNLMQNIASGISILFNNSIYINSIYELLDLKKPEPKNENLQQLPVNGDLDLELRNVTFTYPHAKKPTLKNVSLKIPAGKIVAVVGLNGAGKSTLIKILCKLYEPDSGFLKLGDQDVRQVEANAYRRQISPVFQDFSHYNFSAADNIRFGDLSNPNVAKETIAAAKKSGAHEFIQNFPEGYETIMGRLFEDGHEVSIGQWQKLALARAFYSQARFLILDEATSALDALAEQELFDSFRKHIGNRAAVVVSHRHSAVKHADYIYVLSGGEILQEGTDDELLNMEGDYSRLFKHNLKD